MYHNMVGTAVVRSKHSRINQRHKSRIRHTYLPTTSRPDSFFEVEVERSRKLEFQLGSLPSVRLQAIMRTHYAVLLRDDNVK